MVADMLLQVGAEVVQEYEGGVVLLVGEMLPKQALELLLLCHSQSQMKFQLLRGESSPPQ